MIDFSPIWISLKTAIVTILIVFFLGILAAWWVVRRKNEVSKIFIDGILSLPLVLPPTVTGFFLLYVFGNNRAAGQFFNQQFGVQIAFSWVATVLAAAVISFPLMYRSARGAFEQVDVELLQAGRTLGMSEWSIFRKVLLPNALPGIVSGGVLAFARGLGEFGATAMIAGNIVGKTRTLPLAVYSSVVSGEIGEAAYYVAIVVVICLVMVVGLNWYLYLCKKRQGN
ncbi:MAG: molybdate ABC transporter permease subunit [Phascolarctobacterium sp.]|nr:molybdate ABC transporter permease subunit [Phascolarctobacterium sp.]